MNTATPTPRSGLSTTVSIIRPREFDAATAQTGGAERLAAVTRSREIATVSGAACSRSPPAGALMCIIMACQETVAFVLEGRCQLRWGERGEFTDCAEAGDFLHIPPWLLHMEINPSSDRPVRWVVVRSTPEPIVVNVPGAWDDASRAELAQVG